MSAGIYDVQGRLAAPLLDESIPAGEHPLPFNAAKLSPGLYWYRISTGDAEMKGRMTIVK